MINNNPFENWNMNPEDLVLLFFKVFLLVFGIMLIFGLAGCAVAVFRDRSRRRKAVAQTAASYPAEGVILDAKLVQDPPGIQNPLHYKYSIRYADSSGAQHRALIGISTNTPLQYAAGQAIPLRVLQQSLIVPDADAFNPNRSASGIIDCPVSFRKWLGKPIDETGTVMLEHDYNEVLAELEKKSRSQQIAGILMLFGAAISLVLLIAFVAFYQLPG